MTIVFKKFTIEQRDDVLQLFEMVFGRKMSKEYFHWRYVDAPWGHGLFSLAYDGETLVASYSIMSSELIVNQESIKVGFSMTTMTHPDYRGQGLFPKLANHVYEQASANGYDLIVGFPNDLSYNGFVNKLGWTGFGNLDLHTISEFAKILQFSEHRTSNLEVVELLDKDVGRIDNVINHDFSYIPIKFPRGTKYLSWRFRKNPIDDYEIFGLYRETTLCGYYVLKYYDEDGVTITHLIDFSIEQITDLYDILIHLYEQAAIPSSDKITFWLNTRYLEADNMRILKSIITTSKMSRTYFGYKVISDRLNPNTISILQQKTNWDLRMSDSDTF